MAASFTLASREVGLVSSQPVTAAHTGPAQDQLEEFMAMDGMTEWLN